MIVVDLFYRLEVDHTLQLGLMFVCREEEEEGEKKTNICLFRALRNIDSGRLFLARQVNVV